MLQSLDRARGVGADNFANPEVRSRSGAQQTVLLSSGAVSRCRAGRVERHGGTYHHHAHPYISV